jgi:hypothetical protein
VEFFSLFRSDYHFNIMGGCCKAQNSNTNNREAPQSSKGMLNANITDPQSDHRPDLPKTAATNLGLVRSNTKFKSHKQINMDINTSTDISLVADGVTLDPR